MRANQIFCCFVAALTLIAPLKMNAQTEVTESGNPYCVKPKDAIYASSMSARMPLAHNHIEERDVMWEKRIWREIDVKELRNHHFVSEKRPLISILLEAVNKGDLLAYSAINDEFTEVLSDERMEEMMYSCDTIQIVDPITFEVIDTPVCSEFNPADIARYRVKEVWYYDSRLSRMNVRILGVAPIINKYDDNGNFIATMPLCWFYFDDARSVLSKEPVLKEHNDKAIMSWDDVFVMRDFGSYITKQSNTRDLRLQDMYSGVDLLHESDKIKDGIFNFEHDLYSY